MPGAHCLGSLRGDGWRCDRSSATNPSYTLGELDRALVLTGGRKGNRTKRQLLLDSRAEPWSKAERLLHHLLRAAGVTGWKANRPVVLDDSTFYVDVMFRKLKLAIEIDGRLYHTGAEVFERDRWRQISSS